MVAQLLTGSMLPALGFAAALVVLAGFAFAREVLGSVPRAVLAAALLAFAPFTLMLSGTYLNYVFALGLFLVFGTLLLRGVRTGSTPLLVGAGVLWGVGLLTRPYDSVLFALPFAIWIVVSRRHDLPGLGRIVGWLALGALPGLLVAGAYNVATSGNPLQFPTTTQSEGVSAFGWGVRSIAPDTPELNFTVAEAFESLGTNSWAVPTWLLGAYVTLGLAGWGAFRLWRTDRAMAGILLGLVAVFPVGYLAWWASSLTTNGALNGLGPHYYLPIFAPIAVLAAEGAADLARHHRRVLVAAVAVGAVLTVVLVIPKVDEKQDLADSSRSYAGEVRAGLEQRATKPALLIQERRNATYVMEPYPFLANPPDLDAPVLYARDRGARGIDLLDRMPDREAYRIVRQIEPGTDLSQIPATVEPQTVVRGSDLVARTTITNASGQRTVTTYARFGRHTERRLLTTDGTKDQTFEVTWRLTPEGLEYEGPPARRLRPITQQKAARRGTLVVGATFSARPNAKDPDAVERRYYARVEPRGGGRVAVLTADEEWTRFGPPIHAWIPIKVGGQLEVTLTAEAGATPVP
jgi:hypothetical protein